MILCVLRSTLVCYFFIFSLCERSGLGGADIFDKFGMKFRKWCMLPINDLSCFRVLGGSIFIMASVFRFVGFIPSGFILYPSHVISVTANSNVCKLIARFSLSKRVSTLSDSFSWSESDPLVMIIMSSRKACAELMFTNVQLLFWMLPAYQLVHRNRLWIYTFL